MKALAIYNERVPLVMRRKFELFEDRILVTIWKPLSRQEIPIELAKLDSTAGRLWKVKPYFRLSSVMGVLLLLTFPLTIRVFAWQIAWLHWGVSGLVAGLLITGFQKVEWAQFRNIANIVVLDIARHGPDKKKHEAFVDRIMMQIELAKQHQRESAVLRLKFPPGPNFPPGGFPGDEFPPDDNDFRSN